MIKTIGDLRKAIKHLDDDDIIYAVTAYPEHKNLDILCVQDSTSIGFWEIHLCGSCTAYTPREKEEEDEKKPIEKLNQNVTR